MVGRRKWKKVQGWWNRKRKGSEEELLKGKISPVTYQDQPTQQVKN